MMRTASPLCLVLLPTGFTEPTRSPESLVSSYLTVSPLPPGKRTSPIGGLLSVALSLALRRVGVTHCRVLWSPDFPLRRRIFAAIAEPSPANCILPLRHAIRYESSLKRVDISTNVPVGSLLRFPQGHRLRESGRHLRSLARYRHMSVADLHKSPGR